MPKVFMVAGYVASGKTTVANRLADVTRANVIRTDDIRKELFPIEFDYGNKQSSPNRIKNWIESNDAAKIDFQQVINPLRTADKAIYGSIVSGYEHFVNEQKRQVYDAALNKLGKNLSCGHDIILDATFSKKELRNKLYEIAAENAATGVYIVQVVCGEDIVKQRLQSRNRNNSRKTTSNARQIEVYRLIKKEFDESCIESDHQENPKLKRLVYHTDTHGIEMHGEPDSVTEFIKKEVFAHLSSVHKVRGK